MFTLESTYGLKRRGLLSIDNNDFLYNLYLPLIGYKALFIYTFLVNEYQSNIKEGKISYLLDKSDMEISDFLLNKKSLESIGLIQTLEKDDQYVFILKSVLNPNDFFADPVLKGLFVNKVGQEKALKTMKMYEIDNIDFSNYTDISAGVKETFEIDFKPSDVNLNNDCKLVAINKNSLKDSFDEIKLIEYIAKNSNISIKEITPQDIKEMHKLGNLYGLDEKNMGYILIDAYRDDSPKNHKIDYAYCDERCKLEISKYKSYGKTTNENGYINSNSGAANKINYYDSISPREFLKNKQNGGEPIKADLSIISNLSENMGLNNGIINVILDYTLEKLDNKLNLNYCQKIASTIKRKSLNTTLEVYDYLFAKKRSNSTKTSTKLVDNGTSSKKDISLKIDNKKEKMMDDDDLEKLL